MIALYIIKFSLCLLLILLFYRFVLENEKAHHFKRFYLLVGLFLSLSIPLFSFSFAFDPLADDTFRGAQDTKQVFLPIKAVTLHVGSKLLPILILVLYLGGVLIFSFRLIASLKKIKFQIAFGKKIRHKDYILVLTHDNVMHHSFLNFIFINRKKYENEEIPFEVIKHELVHVRQRHTLDLLLVEILQVLLWFNPLIIFYRYLVKRNHEFLADEGVLCQHLKPSRYAEILLNQTLHFPDQRILSYFKDDFVKSRILMMTKVSSLRILFMKLGGLLPLLVIIFLLFSNSSIAEHTSSEFNVLQENFGTKTAFHENHEKREVLYIDVLINSKKDIKVQNLSLQRRELNQTIHKILSFSGIDDPIVLRIYADGSLPVGFITDLENEIFKSNPNIRSRKRFILI